jgi:hypothetical protein
LATWVSAPAPPASSTRCRGHAIGRRRYCRWRRARLPPRKRCQASKTLATIGRPPGLRARGPAARDTFLEVPLATRVNGEYLHLFYASVGDDTSSSVGTYAITGTLANGTRLLANYRVTLTSGILTVSPYAIRYQIGSDSQTYGSPANLGADLGSTIPTGVNGETLVISRHTPFCRHRQILTRRPRLEHLLRDSSSRRRRGQGKWKARDER